MKKRIYIYCASIVLVLFVTFGLYFYMFHGSISNDSYIWSNFGSYVNGLLTPLLAIINIAVFIDLTIAITNLEEQRSKRESENERELLLMQLRKQEIDTFVQQMNKLNEYSSREDGIESLNKVVHYLQAFEKTGFKYFNIEDRTRATQLLHRLYTSMQQYISNIEDDKEFDEKLYYKIYDSREELIKVLVDSTLVSY